MNAERMEIAADWPVEVIVKGGRKPRRIWLRGSLPIEVPRVAEADAPVVIDIVTSGGRRMVRRMIGDGMFAPCSGQRRAESGLDAFTLDGLLAADARVRSNLLFSEMPRLPCENFRRTSDFLPLNVAVVVEDGRERRREEIAKIAADRLVFVGGVLHRSLPEPVIRLQRGLVAFGVSATVETGPFDDYAFRLDRRDAMREFCARIGEAAPRPRAKGHVDLNALSFREDLHNAKVATAKVLSYAGARLSATRSEAIVRLAVLAKAGEDLAEGSAGVEAVEAALTAIAEADCAPAGQLRDAIAEGLAAIACSDRPGLEPDDAAALGI